MQESVIYQDIKAQGVLEGVQSGKQQGKADLVLRLLKRRIGEIEANDETRINILSEEQLEALGEALLDFSSYDDLSSWLANN